MNLELRNPHSVLAAMKTRASDVVEIRSTAAPHGAWLEVWEEAARLHIPVVQDRRAQARVTSRKRGKPEPSSSGRTGGVTALVKERRGVELVELFDDAPRRADGRGIWLALDCIQDPHNVGAIFRTAAFYGIEGVIVTTDRSAPLSSAVYDVACGGLEYVPFHTAKNLARSLQHAKQAGVWVLGTDERAAEEISQIDRGRPWVVVVGNEERGLRRLTLEHCDQTCRLPARGPVETLNVSVATAVILTHLVPAMSSPGP